MGTNPNSGAPPAVKAVEVCRYFTLSDEGKTLLNPEMWPDQFARALIDKKKHPDAVQLLAHYLPKRQGVFWALSCVKQVVTQPTPEVDAAIKATERWIADPNEENRQATLKAADTADAGTPAGCAALAAYYSDGLPRTEDARTNAKSYFLTAKLVGSSVLLAATSDEQQMEQRFEAFLERGLEILQRVRRQ